MFFDDGTVRLTVNQLFMDNIIHETEVYCTDINVQYYIHWDSGSSSIEHREGRADTFYCSESQSYWSSYDEDWEAEMSRLWEEGW